MASKEEIKKRREKLAAISKRISEKRPLIKHPLLGVLAQRIADNTMSESDIDRIDSSLIFWPQQVGKKVKGSSIPPDTEIKKVIKAYNEFLKAYTPLDAKEYTLEQVIAAEYKEFQKFDVKGLKYIGLLFEDGEKTRYSVGKQPKKTQDKQNKRRWEKQEKETTITESFGAPNVGIA